MKADLFGSFLHSVATSCCLILWACLAMFFPVRLSDDGQWSEQKLRVVGGGGGGGVIICKMSGVTHVPIVWRHV